jgi:hypothetical protein
MSAFELDKQIDEMIESKRQTSSTTILSAQGTASGTSTNAPKLSILIHSSTVKLYLHRTDTNRQHLQIMGMYALVLIRASSQEFVT